MTQEIEKPEGLSPLEEKWYEGLPDSMKRIIGEHGLVLFHFTLNRAAIGENLQAMSQMIRSRDAQVRLQQLLGACNVLITLAEKGHGITAETHAACRRDLDLAIQLGNGQETTQIIIPAHLKH